MEKILSYPEKFRIKIFNAKKLRGIYMDCGENKKILIFFLLHETITSLASLSFLVRSFILLFWDKS